MKKRTGYIYDPIYRKHSLGFGHPEAPERLQAVESLLQASGLLQIVTRPKISIEDQPALGAIKHIHSDTHINSVIGAGETGQIALAAVKGVLEAVNDIAAGDIDNAFCAVRPPGHHSHNNGADYDGPGQGEGFCFFNNAAIAARYAQQRHGMERVLIIDWDYHHGNGTEWSFYSDPSVFFFSTHILYGYPGTGFPEKKGDGPGLGYNLNVPLESGDGDDEILNVWENQFLPALDDVEFSPDLVVISAGFDSREEDLLGTFRITDDGYAKLTRMAMKIAETHCGGKLLSVLEGGYTPAGLAKAVVSHMSALTGE